MLHILIERGCKALPIAPFGIEMGALIASVEDSNDYQLHLLELKYWTNGANHQCIGLPIAPFGIEIDKAFHQSPNSDTTNCTFWN